LTASRLVQLSKLLSLILRHRPDQFDVILDPEGFADLRDVLVAVRKHFHDATQRDLIAVVQTVEPQKQRFSILDGEIRANYGHSLAGRIEHPAGEPPGVLWHGTCDRSLPGIVERGILPMKRQYVHLTLDWELAARIGARHGTACVISVDAARAYAEGVVFYRANASFWLANEIAPTYLQI
jgi:putative RNA 2'-phosphotransferase